jgi:hypothetical protein
MGCEYTLKNLHFDALHDRKLGRKLMLLPASVLLLYFLGSVYFMNHFFFHTFINGVNVSLKKYKDADDIIRRHLKQYRLEIVDRNGQVEYIYGREIGLQFNEKIELADIGKLQKPFQWICYAFRDNNYELNHLYRYHKGKLKQRIEELNCLNTEVVEPRNVSFRYVNGSYKVIREVYGNKILRDKLYAAIEDSINDGRTKIDLEEMQCYQNPRYTLQSKKTAQTKSLLEKYSSAHITYLFGDRKEVLDGKAISRWLKVDDNLDVIINKYAVLIFIKSLSKRYDTVGTTRIFRTSTGSTVEVTGGLYGWKIDQNDEYKALINHISQGEQVVKEPAYLQRAAGRGENEFGDTYMEINITRQHLWFYKNGKLIAHGPVVTGNPLRGFSTVLGSYMVVYKQRNATLVGPGYEAKVNYWMPFFGGIGVHDATWRRVFGGDIYRRRGSHGCVNAPLSLARTIFEHIEEGTPVILYEER